MPLIRLAPGFGDRALPNIYGDGPGRGIGNVGGGLVPRPPKTRHPEGDFIPEGRGIFANIFKSGIRIPDFPVGSEVDRRDIGFPKVPGVSIVSPVPVFIRSEASPATIAGGRAPQNKEVLPVKIATPSPILPTVRSGPTPNGVGLQTTTLRGETMPSVTDFFRDLIPGDSDIFDLGANLLGFMGTGQAAPPAIPSSIPTTYPSSPGVAVPSTVGIDPGFAGRALTGCESDPRNQYVLKFICGEWKWVKKRKRRRKRLATSSDIKDLSSLKGVLGGGKSFDLWIATHA